MKKLLTILFLLISFAGVAQYPIKQTLGTDSTEVSAKGAIKGRVVNAVFIDTTAANLTRLKQYPGAQIYTTSDNSFWLRNSTASQWLFLITKNKADSVYRSKSDSLRINLAAPLYGIFDTLTKKTDSLGIDVATDSQDGFLTAADHAAFNAKYNASDTPNIIRWKQFGNDIYNSNTGNVEIRGNLYSKPSGSKNRLSIFNSGGAVFAFLDNTGRLIFNSSNAASPAPFITISNDGSIPTFGGVTPMIAIQPAASDQSGIIIKANTGQTGNLQSFRDASSNILLTVDNLGSLAFGSDIADRNALIDMRSTTKGFLPPRMTASQKTAIPSAATGMIIYQTDGTEGLYQKLSSGWAFIGGSSTDTTNYMVRLANSWGINITGTMPSRVLTVDSLNVSSRAYAIKVADSMSAVRPTPTFQQVLTAGSTLTTDNNIDGGATNGLLFYNNLNFSANASNAITFTQFGTASRKTIMMANQKETSLKTENTGSTNGSYLYVYKDSIMIQPQFGNLYIDSLNHSVSTKDKMMVWDSVSQKVATRLIPSGGGSETDPVVKAISGIVKSDGTTISSATSGTDYAPATSGTGILKGNGSGGFSTATASTDYLVPGDATTAATASKIVQRDANGNIFVNTDVENLSLVTTSGGSTTLTASSAHNIIFSGTLAHTLILPNATTMGVGEKFDSHNQVPANAITVQTNGGATLWTIAPGVDAEFICTNNSTSAGTWEIQYSALNTATAKSLTVNNTLTLAGTDATTITFPSTSQNVVGETSTQTLTNKTLTSPVINVGSDAQGDIYYRSSGGTFTRLAPGTAGQYLATGGAAANPSWVTATALTNTLNVVTLGSAFSSTVTTEATVTGMSFAVTAGKNYMVEVIGTYQTAATTTGGELGFFLTASGVGTIVGNAEGGIVSTAAATSLSQQISAIGAADLANSNLITTGVTAINSPHYIKAKVIFVCTTSGTFNVGWATEVAASAAQLNAGSTLIYQQLN